MIREDNSVEQLDKMKATRRRVRVKLMEVEALYKKPQHWFLSS